MQAVVLREFGESDKLRIESMPDPRPDQDEVLIRVRACGVCYHDVINRRGDLPRTKVPAILGHEAAGEVVDVGPGVVDWKIGDRVATLQRLFCGACHHCRTNRPSLCKKDARFFGEEIPGGYASYLVAPVRGLGRVPYSVGWDVAATTCCTTGTAVHVVRNRGRIREGETVLITGASGGVGLQAVQLARLQGAYVIAVTSNEAKCEALLDAGAQEIIVSRALDFSREVRARTGGEGTNVALEIVGSKTFAESLKSLAPGGRAVVIGNLEGGSFSVNPGLMIVKELTITGAYATSTAELDEAFRLIESGLIRPHVSESLPLKDAGRAHHRLENREVAGRLVLVPAKA
jgi:D-arabinose 1-dehydrogenase-like Zn-dependent alcohol dehydrogenase